MELAHGLKEGSNTVLLPVMVDASGRLCIRVDAGQLNIQGTVEVANDAGNPLPVAGPLTNAELRATPMVVSGNAPVGTAPSGNPVSCAGVDPAGNKQHIRTDVAGRQEVFGAVRNCVGRQALDVTTGAVATLTVPAGAVAAAIQADGSAISITLEGTAPSATVGTRIDDGVIYYVDTALANVKLIARQATTKVQVVYFDKP